MLEVEPPGQGDGHVLEMSNGDTIVVDTGLLGTRLMEYLRRREIRRIKKVILSHFHRDHYGGFPRLLDSGIPIGELIVSLPVKRACDQEVPWGCDFQHMVDTLYRVKWRGIPVRRPRAGEVLYENGNVKIRALCAYDGEHSPVGRTDVNDTSIVMKMFAGTTTALFTGDLNSALSRYLATNSRELKSDILKVPHHGTEGTATDEFFDAVGAKVALVPSPAELWRSERSQRIRRYFGRHAKTYVYGINGDVTVDFFPDRYEITSVR